VSGARRVNHAGRFDPCCAPDADRLFLGSFGSLAAPDASLAQLWRGDRYQTLVRDYASNPLCHECNMRVPPEQINKNSGTGSGAATS
jgi:hypothetical protein